MHPQFFSRISKRGVKLCLILFSILVVCVTGLVFTARSGAQEREFKNTVPEHVPIKVKVKNEEKFKKLDNKDWVRDLEIEVKNTSGKPIYFMYALLVLPEVTVGGISYAMQITYGRKELVSYDAPLQPEDVPIKPGESVTLKIPLKRAKAYEGFRDDEKRKDPKKVEFRIQLINFGDGTGIQGTVGTPMSLPLKKRASNQPGGQDSSGRCPPAPGSRSDYSPGSFLKASYSGTPASFLRAFFSAEGDLDLGRDRTRP